MRRFLAKPQAWRSALSRAPAGVLAVLAALATCLGGAACRTREAPQRELAASASAATPQPIASVGSASGAAEADDCELPPATGDALRALGASPNRVPLRDYGRLRASSSCYFAIAPEAGEQVGRIVKQAEALHVPVRVRGRAHSANGSTLPRRGELLLLTHRLNDVAFNEPGTVDVGAGVPVRALDILLRTQGFSLPVINDGGTGPSVGGYISAGGMGSGAREHGGFWENVLSVKLVDGRGDLREIKAAEPDFPWLFGAMGQLGVIVEARLRILPIADAPSYPQGRRKLGDVPSDVAALLKRGPNEKERLHWFTLLIRPEQKQAALAALGELTSRHASALSFRPPYEYPFKVKRDTPPLFFGPARALVAVGMWGDVTPTTTESALDALEQDFQKLVREHTFRRYIQAETPGSPGLFRDYFGDSLYARFRATKERYDPGHLINRGSVFGVDP